MTSGSEKILSKDQLVERIKTIRSSGTSVCKVGFTNGCFDILHVGHIRYLKKARTECDFLIVGVNSDRSVRELKGSDRPINPQDARAELLSELLCVDFVTIFDEKTPLDLIVAVMPDVIFKGGDWKESDIVGAFEVKKNGGRAVVVPFEKGYSTTSIISRMRKGKSE